jgi:hypothetical protein
MLYAPIRETKKVVGAHSDFVQSVDGMWKSKWVPRPAERPLGFFRDDCDISSWVEFPLPTKWEFEGHGWPIYLYGTTLLSPSHRERWGITTQSAPAAEHVPFQPRGRAAGSSHISVASTMLSISGLAGRRAVIAETARRRRSSAPRRSFAPAWVYSMPNSYSFRLQPFSAQVGTPEALSEVRFASFHVGGNDR